MKKKSFLNTLFDAIGSICFIKYVLPILLIIFIILLVIQLSYNFYLPKTLDNPENIIYSSKFQTFIQEIAKKNVDKTEFNLVSEVYPLNLDYHVINKNHTAEEYDALVKNEITKIYNEIKDKKIINNGIFGTKDPVREYIYVAFIYNDASIYSDYLGIFKLIYNEENGFKESYEKIMNSTIITQTELDNFKK